MATNALPSANHASAVRSSQSRAAARDDLASVPWLGLIEAEPAHPGADAEVAAIEAGAQDFEPGDAEGSTLFVTDPTDLDIVSRALPVQGFNVLSAKLGYRPKNPIDPASLSPEQLEEVESFLAAIDGNDDVQNVFVGLAG
jgi:transcriptional/translational regulatory protein YebC/TACO1